MSRPAAPAADAARAGRPHLHLVRRRSRKLIQRTGARRVAPLAVVLALCSLAVVFSVLLERVLLAQSAFEVARIRGRLARAQNAHEELLLASSQLEDPDRIERYARQQLGMVDPAPSSVRYIVANMGVRLEHGLTGRVARVDTPAVGEAASGLVEAP